MAEALVSFVLEKIRDTIWQELEEEAKLVLGVHKQVKNLTTTLRSLQVLLRDADLKQVNDADVKEWLEELKHIAYDADDVLDEWRTAFLLSQLNPVTPTFTEKIIYYLFSPCSSHIPAYFSCLIPDDLLQHHRIANEIQGINERLDPIDRNSIRDRLTRIPIHPSHPRPATSSEVIVAEIHGRDGDKKFIVDWLHGDHSSCTSVPVLSIVGTGGFGKTTLAQIVFKQEKTRFERAIWVCVSQPFDREKVAKEIIEQATRKKAQNFAGWESLHQQLSDSIKGNQFLIVLDDVWSKDHKDWDPFRLSLNGGAHGSRVIVTTRDERVAMMMGSKTHRLGGLSKQDCWLLFQQIAFAERSQKERETLKEIGEEIAAKCKGVPLAAKTIASLMRFKRTKKEWRDVLKSDIWELPQEEDDLLPSLLLSYHDLPSDLKQCFLYCAIFPKDAGIKKDLLVKLWMAQGFLELNGDEELEIIGGYYFDDLAMRSFFQDFEEEDEGKIIACKMHDLVHDFAQFLTKTECFILEKNDTLLNGEKRRHINARDIDIESLSSFNEKKLRSLMMRPSKLVLSELFCQVTCLRSLDLSFSSLEKLPDEVEILLHLRYLDLSGTELTELPETMCKLYNLQTLKLIRCKDLCKLPEGIGRLLNLRHLECQYAFNLSYFPQGFGKLKRLRTLHKFVVSNASGGCELEELKDLNSINGELEIIGLRQVGNIDEAKRAELQRKANIVSLTLDFSEVSEQMITSEENENNMEEIIEGLQPHNDLEQLEIQYYPGMTFPCWMLTMSNLVNLVLKSCDNCTQLPALGMLPSLVTLRIDSCRSIKQVGVEFLGISESEIQQQTTFPKLRELKLRKMGEWEEWNLPLSLFTQNEILPTLSILEISNCPKLKALPATINKLSSLDRLRLEGMGGSGDILGICGFVNRESMSLFPKLTTLELSWMGKWEEEIHETTASTISIMPNLLHLSISTCEKLKVIPNYLFSHNLRELKISECPKLIGMPSLSNLSSLESLEFGGNVGVFSKLLASIIIGSNSNNHNLKSFKLIDSPHSSLPQGLNHFKSLQELVIEFNPEEELKVIPNYLRNLRKLRIAYLEM